MWHVELLVVGFYIYHAHYTLPGLAMQDVGHTVDVGTLQSRQSVSTADAFSTDVHSDHSKVGRFRNSGLLQSFLFVVAGAMDGLHVLERWPARICQISAAHTLYRRGAETRRRHTDVVASCI